MKVRIYLLTETNIEGNVSNVSWHSSLIAHTGHCKVVCAWDTTHNIGFETHTLNYYVWITLKINHNSLPYAIKVNTASTF